MDWNPVKRKRLETFSTSSKYYEPRKNDSESDGLLSDHSDSPSHKSEESVHSTDNYHYVKKIIKYSSHHQPGLNPPKSFKKTPPNGSKISSKSKNSYSKSVFNPPKLSKKPKKEKSKSDPEKDEIISKILQRWWYALEDWPPVNFKYSAALKKLKLTLIPSDQPFSSKKSSQEVKIFPGYTGVYFNPSGIHDLRPQDTCPSYNNLYKKPLKELKEILNKAFKNQILQLKSQNPPDVELIFDLQNEINSIKTNI